MSKDQHSMNPLKEARLRDAPARKNPFHAYAQSYRKVSERTGVQVRQLERWENGDTIPNEKSAEALAQHFGFASARDLRLALRRWQEQHRPDRTRFYQSKDLLQTA